MANYLAEIENEFSRGRGHASRLSPMDWNLADQMQSDGIPLRIVLRVMSDGFKRVYDLKKTRQINSLRYFEQEVYKQFAEWQTSQVGKAPDPLSRTIPFTEEINMQNSSFAAMTAQTDENVEFLDQLAAALMPDEFTRRNITLPETLAPTVAKIRGEILALLDDATQKQLSSNDIETRLTALRAELEIVLIISVSDDERAAILKQVKTEYGRFHLMEDAEKKVLIRKLYQKFGLPELSLYAL